MNWNKRNAPELYLRALAFVAFASFVLWQNGLAMTQPHRVSALGSVSTPYATIPAEVEVTAKQGAAAQQDRVQIHLDAPRLKTATFSPGVKVGKLLFVSGQISIDPNGNIVGRGDFSAQCKQVFDNMGLVLEKAGASYSDVVKINTFLTDMRNYQAFAQIRGQYFSRDFPASTVVAVNGFVYEGVLIEVEAIAVLK